MHINNVNYDMQWKVDTVQQYSTIKRNMGQLK